MSNSEHDHKLMTISWSPGPAFNPNIVNRKSTVVYLRDVKTDALPEQTGNNASNETPSNEKSSDNIEQPE